MKTIDIEKIVAELTLEEKVSLCSGASTWLTEPIERLGVPAVRMNDGPHGLRKEIQSAGTNIMSPAEPSTCYPPAVTLASSWDVALVEEVGAAIAEEAKALQVTTVLGPGINIKRSPLCGRNFEYFSEDPFLSGQMGAAWVRGVQHNGVGTSLKHYCVNNQEHLRMSIDAIVDERTLRELYLPAFEHIVKTEQPTTVMCSYNRLNGTYLSDDKWMLTDVLRDEWGFRSLVVSDWGAVNGRVAGIRAGMDLEMPGNKGANDREIVKAIQAGTLSEADLDRVVFRVLEFIYTCKEKETAGGTINIERGDAVARKAAAAGAVLLKNENNALPLRKEQSIAVIGALAKQPRYQGAGSSNINPTKITSFITALEQANQPFTYADGYTLKGDGYSSKLLRQAVDTARGADAVIVYVGLTDDFESEGYDRIHTRLPQAHDRLVQELTKVHDNVIVVLSCGSPVQVHAWEQDVQAILNLYLGGQASGVAAYDLLYGAVNPSGKLAETFPLHDKGSVVDAYFPMGPRTVEHRESIYVGYRYYDKAQQDVQYPFGYGLSYTTFAYSNLRLSASDIDEGETLTATFRIKNTGNRAGAEVAELYVRDVESTIFRPDKELKGFVKVYLEPNEEQEVAIELDARAFRYYNVLLHDWHIESGVFSILIGASSRDIRLSADVTVRGKNEAAPIPDYYTQAPWYYDLGKEGIDGHEVPIAQFEALYGAPMRPNTPFRKGELTINSSIQQLRCSTAGRLTYGVLTLASRWYARGNVNAEMMRRSFQDMPVRGLTGMLEGMVSPLSAEGIVDLCNGKKGGIRKILRGLKS